jgi:hypothetical protein
MSLKKIIFAAMICLLSVWLMAAAGAATLLSDDFEDGNSTGWSTSNGSWSVVSDGSRVYKQSGTSTTAHAYRGTSSWANYSVQARAKALSFNGSDRYFGLLARFSSSSNYYYLTLGNANKLEIRKKVGGTVTVLASKTYTVTAGTWYLVKLVVNGNSLQAYVNDTLELSAADSSFATGKIGCSAYYASAEFDDILVDDLSAGTGTPTPTPSTATPTPTPSGATPTPTPSVATPTPTVSGPTPTPVTGAFYVAPFGNDGNPGTFAQPFYSIARAIEVAGAAGSTIYVRGGTYNYSSTINLSQSGTASAKINLWAYPGENPVLDFSTQPYGSSNRAFVLTGNYWYIKGLEICYGGDNGIKVEGSYNIIEQCVLHHNGDSGIQLGFGHETENPGGTLCSYNQIINCDSYLNFDFDNMGSDADGFACKMHNGKGNVFRGCRSWRNSDDGWDLYETDWPVEIIGCWTWHNGDQTDFNAIYLQKMGKNMSSFQGNGNGFKLGGNGTGGSSVGTHVVKNCVAFDNNYKSKKGFDQNSHKGGVIVYNCTSFGNGYNYMFEDNPGAGAAAGCVNKYV